MIGNFIDCVYEICLLFFELEICRETILGVNENLGPIAAEPDLFYFLSID